MWISVLHIYMYVHAYVTPALKGQKNALDTLELEFQMAVSHHMGPTNQA